MKTQHIPNPSQRQIIVTSSGLKFADCDDYLFQDEYFTVRYEVPANFSYLYPILNVIPPISELLSIIKSKPNQQVTTPDGAFYQSSHRHADMFHDSGIDHMNARFINEAMLCKTHLINILRALK